MTGETEATKTVTKDIPENESSEQDGTADHKRNNATHKSKAKTTKKEEHPSSKIRHLEEMIQKLESENSIIKDQLFRKVAEFENYKRRTEKEFINHLETANEDLILEILPVIDDFERLLQHLDEPKNQDSHAEGIRLIYKKLLFNLEKKGLKPIDAVGKEFNTDEHQALLQVDSKEHESGHVVEEHLKGYKLNDKVIRHSQVLVAK